MSFFKVMVPLSIYYNVILILKFIDANHSYFFALTKIIFLYQSYPFLVRLNNLNVLRCKTNHLCLRYSKYKDNVHRDYFFFYILLFLPWFPTLPHFLLVIHTLKLIFFCAKFISGNIFVNYPDSILIIYPTNEASRQ